jgi:hypothetical protein
LGWSVHRDAQRPAPGRQDVLIQIDDDQFFFPIGLRARLLCVPNQPGSSAGCLHKIDPTLPSQATTGRTELWVVHTMYILIMVTLSIGRIHEHTSFGRKKDPCRVPSVPVLFVSGMVLVDCLRYIYKQNC